MRKPALFYSLLIILLWGCATWVMVGGKFAMESGNFEAELPEGWRRYNPDSDALRMTKDGMALQQIIVSSTEVDKELPFTKKRLSKGMLPQEAAEVMADNIKSNSNISNLEIIENNPSIIDGHSGFRLIYVYHTRSGLRKKGIYYGFIVGKRYYEIIYEAPARYYYEKDLPAFERVRDTFRLLKPEKS